METLFYEHSLLRKCYYFKIELKIIFDFWSTSCCSIFQKPPRAKWQCSGMGENAKKQKDQHNTEGVIHVYGNDYGNHAQDLIDNSEVLVSTN